MTGRKDRAAASRAGSPPHSAFSVVDEVTCYFDTPNEPANIQLEVRIPFQLDPQAFTDAALAALAANPRACSRRARRSRLRSGYAWERPARFDVDPVSFTTFADLTELAAKRVAFIARSPSIDASPPAALLVASGPDCVHVILNAHHAAMDGLSWLELLRDIGRRYRSRCGQATGAIGAAIPRPAATRSPAPVPARPAASAMAATPPAVAAPVGPRIGGRPARIARDGGGQRGLGLHMMLLPDVPAVPPTGSCLRPTLNDALITALIVTIGRWNTDHGRPARTIRVTVPVNARTESEPAAGNLTRLVTISAMPPAPGSELSPLLLEVARQTRRAREQQGPPVGPGARGIAVVWCPTPVKRWLVRAALRTVGPLVCDTVMLTNLGNVPDPPDFGGGPVTMAFSAAAQMPRGASVAAITAGQQPQIAVRYNRALLSDDAAARFIAALRHAIGELTVSSSVRAGASPALNLDWSQPVAGGCDPMQSANDPIQSRRP